MRFLAFLLFLGFIALTLFARWFVVCKVYHLCAEPVEEDVRLKTLKLTENDSIILLQGYDQFAFDSAAVQPRMNANNEAFLAATEDVLPDEDELEKEAKVNARVWTDKRHDLFQILMMELE